MIEHLKMPKLSPTMRSGVIVKWHKTPRESITQGDLLFEVATDKATVEHHALDAGYLLCTLVSEGQQAHLGEVIALFGDNPDEDFSAEKEKILFSKNQDEKSTSTENSSDEEAEPANHLVSANTSSDEGGSTGIQQNHIPISDALTNYTFEFPARQEEKPVCKSSPFARLRAKILGVDLRNIKGSGPGSRIVASDVEKAAKSCCESEVSLGFPLSLGAGEMPTKPPGSYDRIPMSPMRSAIASRLQQSKTHIPHFYVKTCLDVSNLFAMRTQLKSVGLKVSINDMLLRASALALRAHPKINVGFDSKTSEMIQFKTVDISVAVSIDSGLITPIIRHADYKNLQHISTQVKELASKAREGLLKPEEFEGGSFTVSNLGMYGVCEFSAIINPPQGAILAVGAPVSRVKLEGEKPVSYQEMTLTLSCDHRIIDGGDAALFLKTLKDLLMRPNTLLMV